MVQLRSFAGCQRTVAGYAYLVEKLVEAFMVIWHAVYGVKRSSCVRTVSALSRTLRSETGSRGFPGNPCS